ncbi:hypothetical protein EV424DRAFT_1350015 [Suillus variegatus]|nr:hypothetical protein EV424DRAFT_1350015 [Suillus variegatus]
MWVYPDWGLDQSWVDSWMMVEVLRMHETEQCKRLFAGAVTITVICAQYTTLLMAQPGVNVPPQSKAPPAQWNDAETAALVNYLYNYRSEAEGGGSFKQQVLSSAAEYINNHETLQSTQAGPLKTAKST